MAHVKGTLKLRHVARLLREAPAELRKEMRTGIRKPLKPYEEAVRAEVASSVPARYASVLAPAIKTRLLTSLGRGSTGAGYSFEVYARGKTEDRDVAAINAGTLRHKTFGHYPWSAQRVRGGFVDRPLDRFAQQIVEEIDKAIDTVAEKIERG